MPGFIALGVGFSSCFPFLFYLSTYFLSFLRQNCIQISLKSQKKLLSKHIKVPHSYHLLWYHSSLHGRSSDFQILIATNLSTQNVVEFSGSVRIPHRLSLPVYASKLLSSINAFLAEIYMLKYLNCKFE